MAQLFFALAVRAFGLPKGRSLPGGGRPARRFAQKNKGLAKWQPMSLKSAEGEIQARRYSII
jgi:hypothetical protein